MENDKVSHSPLAELHRSRREALAAFEAFWYDLCMDYPPLLEPGFYDLPINGLKEVLWEQFVEPFENQGHREYLVENFVSLIGELQNLGIPLEVWFDGSFVTEKPVPNDIDLVVFYDREDRKAFDWNTMKMFNRLYDNERTRQNYDCDIYFAEFNDQPALKFWTRWYGVSPLGTPKGIPRIFIPRGE